MSSAMAAAYVDEPSVQAFLRKVGSVYPRSAFGKGRSRRWDQKHLDNFATGNGQGPSLADDL
jgi:hypothetical protein